MGFFVDPNDRVAIHDEANPDNIVYIRAKMDRKTRARVQDDLLRLQISLEPTAPGGEGRGEGSEESATVNATVGIETQKLAYLIHNIVRWEGPDFVDERGRAIPCTRQRIEQLDPDAPLFERVVQEIERRNLPRTQPVDHTPADPNSIPPASDT